MLKSLTIKNFRALEDFHVEKLGRVNLIVGKNNSGKSTVLEAIRLYAGNAQRGLLESVARSHDEKFRLSEIDRSETNPELPFQDFFSGRRFPERDGISITIGDTNAPELSLRIEHVFLEEYEEEFSDLGGTTEKIVRRRIILKSDIADLSQQDKIIRQGIVISKGEKSLIIVLDQYRLGRSSFDSSVVMPCSFVPTQFVSMTDLARVWDKVALTEQEDVVNRAMRCVAPEFEGIVFVDSDEPYTNNAGRREFQRIAKVRMRGFPRPISLNSLGDGMVRVLQLILNVFPAKSGFLVIDEFENGLHYSVQESIWSLIFDLAENLDFQVFATTHGWDCVESFAKVAKTKGSIDASLFRVGKSALKSSLGRIISTSFSKDELYNISQLDVEVR